MREVELLVGGFAGKRGVVVNARGVIEKLADGDVAPVHRGIGNVAGDFVVEAELVLVGELENHAGRDVLGDGGDVEHGFGR